MFGHKGWAYTKENTHEKKKKKKKEKKIHITKCGTGDEVP